MISIFFKTIRDKKFRKIEEFRVGSWINIEDATVEDLRIVAELAELEYSDLQDSMDRYEIPRIERQDGKTLVFVRNPAEYDELYTEILTIILSKKYLITISPGKNQVITHLLDQNTLLPTTQQSKLLLKILLRIAQQFTVKIKEVRNTVLRRKKEVGVIDNKDFIALAESEEILNQYLSTLVPMNNVIEALSSRKNINLYEEDEDLLQDLLIATKQSADICIVNLKSIQSLRDFYQLIFTNNLNKTIKLLTVLTIFLTIPTIIASLFGMNVALPFEQNPFAFIFILGIVFVFILIGLVIFSVKRWL